MVVRFVVVGLVLVVGCTNRYIDLNPDTACQGDDACDGDASADGAEPDGTGDARDAREDSADTCPPPPLCDCSCGSGLPTSGPCCSGDVAGKIAYWTLTGPDGCPTCDCGFIERRTCEYGCFFEGPFGGPGLAGTASCGEEIMEACGNGTLDWGEQCEPGPPEECTVTGCAVPGRLLVCTPTCRVATPTCLLPVEICENGLDDDCDTATDEGCAAECCTDLVDDNGDGNTDCNDPTCADDPACEPCRTGQEICNDGCDNDLDCRTDAEDEDCYRFPGTCPWLACAEGAEVCGNACDDDRDGWVDCADLDCFDDPTCIACMGGREDSWSYRCDDLLDNDCDGMTDACDDDCGYARGIERCADELDNDGDGNTDCADSDCSCDPRCLGVTPEDCADGLDNDGDRLTDEEDWDCPRPCG